MKLEIKHLTPYLPYDLKVVFEADEHEHTLVGLVNWSNEIMVLSPFNDYGRSNIKNCKPILRPLSDLTKEIDHNGEKFIPTELLDSEDYPIDFFVDTKYEYMVDWIENYQEEHHLLFFPWGLINQLFEWHFDVFGLIEKGLAIDINEQLSKRPNTSSTWECFTKSEKQPKGNV